jgi:hypothetical protein
MNLLFLFPSLLCGVEYEHLAETLDIDIEKQPFVYNLGIHLLKGASDDEPVMVCFHGYGSNNKIIDIIRTYREIPNHLVSFNFPDYNLKPQSRDPNTTAFGTIQEILPAMYVLKKVVVDGGAKRVDLYGFSAGGGALVNVIAVLNSNRYDKEISDLGISNTDRKLILSAIQNGYIVLDCPLKSIEEIIASRGHTQELDVFQKRYHDNGFEPIESLKNLDNLPLKVLVHFQCNDVALSNRDDNLYISRLRQYNRKGITLAVKGNDGGHICYHQSLWKIYPQFVEGKCGNSCIVDYSKK